MPFHKEPTPIEQVREWVLRPGHTKTTIDDCVNDTGLSRHTVLAAIRSEMHIRKLNTYKLGVWMPTARMNRLYMPLEEFDNYAVVKHKHGLSTAHYRDCRKITVDNTPHGQEGGWAEYDFSRKYDYAMAEFRQHYSHILFLPAI